jgi:hypothetical protein
MSSLSETISSLDQTLESALAELAEYDLEKAPRRAFEQMKSTPMYLEWYTAQWESQAHRCANPKCRKILAQETINVDHKLPIVPWDSPAKADKAERLWGFTANRLENLALLCETCNKRKSNKQVSYKKGW